MSQSPEARVTIGKMMINISGPKIVQVELHDGSMSVTVDGICRLRIRQVRSSNDGWTSGITVSDYRGAQGA